MSLSFDGYRALGLKANGKVRLPSRILFREESCEKQVRLTGPAEFP
jgi:hypothetical protein